MEAGASCTRKIIYNLFLTYILILDNNDDFAYSVYLSSALLVAVKKAL